MNTDNLEALAQELVIRVRDDNPEANGRWLASLSEQDRWSLLFVLAAAVPDDRPWRHLTMWTYGDGGPDTPSAVRARREALIEEEDEGRREVGPAAVGANQYGRRRKAA